MNSDQTEKVEFENLFRDRLKERGLTLKRVSELSGIALKHLENLGAGRYENLPAAPYLRGYLIKLGQLLDFDGEAWWEHFVKEGLISGSGPDDQLPQNRFARKSLGKRFWLTVAVVVIFAFFGLRFSQILGRPMLTILSPSQTPISVSTKQFLLQGRLSGGDQLIINGEPVNFEEDGGWQKNILLQTGLNTIEITAKKFLGRETKVTNQIIYEPPEGTTSTSPGAP